MWSLWFLCSLANNWLPSSPGTKMTGFMAADGSGSDAIRAFRQCCWWRWLARFRLAWKNFRLFDASTDAGCLLNVGSKSTARPVSRPKAELLSKASSRCGAGTAEPDMDTLICDVEFLWLPAIEEEAEYLKVESTEEEKAGCEMLTKVCSKLDCVSLRMVELSIEMDEEDVHR